MTNQLSSVDDKFDFLPSKIQQQMREARKALANEKIGYEMAAELDYLFIDSPERNALTQQILGLQRRASRLNNSAHRAEDRKAILLEANKLPIWTQKAT